jgi:hypothetical protein
LNIDAYVVFFFGRGSLCSIFTLVRQSLELTLLTLLGSYFKLFDVVIIVELFIVFLSGLAVSLQCRIN